MSRAKIVVPDTVREHRERKMAEAENNIVAFKEGTMNLALENGYPVISPASGAFIHDARCAWFVDVIEAWHVTSQKPRIRKGWFSASALGKTDEELIAAYRGEADDLHDVRRLRIFDLGHDRDRSWKRYMKSAGMTAFKNPVRKMRLKWLRLMGECDEIVRDPDGRLCVVEVKTKSQYLFDRLQEPDEAHRLQVQAYMAGLGIDQSIVLYEAKNTQAIKAFYEPRDAEVWGGIVERLQRLRLEADDRS